MLETIEAVIDMQGQVQLLEKIKLTKKHRALVTILGETDYFFDDNSFFATASSSKSDEIWNNEEDDVYAELLEK
jgi:hypothetical protein